MEIYGRKIRFRRTVAATCEIADLCPDGDIAKIDAMLKGTTRQVFHFQAAFIAALSKGYEDAAQFEDRDHVKQPISVDELSTLSLDEFAELFGEAAAVFADDGKTTVDAKPAKKKEAEAGASA